MSCARRKSSYLSRRGGIYYLRVRVPHDLVERVGRFEIRRSLGVARFDQARLLAAKYAARVFEVFEMIKTEPYSKAETAKLVQSIFADLLLKIERRPFAYETCDSDEELAAQISLSEEWEEKLQHAAIKPGTDGLKIEATKDLLVRQVHGFEKLAPEQQQDLVAGVMRALMEQQRLFRFRLTEQLLPYEPTDPLFKKQIEPLLSPRPLSSIQTHNAQKTGPKVGDLVDKYLKAKSKHCTPKTIKMMAAKLGLLVDHLGQGAYVSEVCVDDMRSFRDGVLRLRKSYRGETGSFSERQTDVAKGRVSLKTASTTFKAIKSFWFWAVKESYLEESPVGKLEVDLKRYKKVKKPRRPFSADDIRELFSAPLFVGCRSRYRRFEAGDLILKDAKYWIPILGYYTGARLGELVQLHIKDVILDHGVPHISINEDDGGHVKHLKSDAAIRTIPIHSDLLELGFDDFVRDRSEKPPKDHRLFHEIKFGEDGQASTVFRYWIYKALR